MFGLATYRGDYARQTIQRLSVRTRDDLEVGLTDLGCAVVGVLMARARFGSNLTRPYLAFSLALPVLFIAALRPAGAHDVRNVGPGFLGIAGIHHKFHDSA
jgi:hypothetical protein